MKSEIYYLMHLIRNRVVNQSMEIYSDGIRDNGIDDKEGMLGQVLRGDDRTMCQYIYTIQGPVVWGVQ